MDPFHRAQVLLLCDLCQRAALQLHCVLCNISLCRDCVREHFSDSSKRHNIVPYRNRYPSPENQGYLRPVKQLLDEPELITTIETGYTQISVACLSDEEIWIRSDVAMNLYNLKGKLLKSIKTKSGNKPRDIAVSWIGDLVYTDPDARTVNKVTNTKIKKVIRLHGWKPYSVCFSITGDLLVIMNNDNKEQSRIVRYTGFTEEKVIQFDSEGKSLYSYDLMKYLSENRNLDICVADCGANAVVVVNQEGKLRFRYTGLPSSELFTPHGITTDSQSQILTSDGYDFLIHILDQDGQFLRYIDNSHMLLIHPSGLCVDTGDNLFVVEWKEGKIKKIKYMRTVF